MFFLIWFRMWAEDRLTILYAKRRVRAVGGDCTPYVIRSPSIMQRPPVPCTCHACAGEVYQLTWPPRLRKMIGQGCTIYCFSCGMSYVPTERPLDEVLDLCERYLGGMLFEDEGGADAPEGQR